MKKAKTGYDAFVSCLLLIASCMGGASAILGTVNAVVRKAVGGSFPWAEELCTYLIVMAVFLAIPFLEWKNKELTVDFLSKSIKNKKVLKALRIFSVILAAILGIIIVKFGWDATCAAHTSHTLTYVLRWPKEIFLGIGVGGFALAVVSSVISLFVQDDGIADKPEGGEIE